LIGNWKKLIFFFDFFFFLGLVGNEMYFFFLGLIGIWRGYYYFFACFRLCCIWNLWDWSTAPKKPAQLPFKPLPPSQAG
jgi:hypothetical protein